MTIMLLSGVPEINSIATEHERYSSRHCRYAGSITGFRYERCETFAYLDSPLYFQAVRDDSYGFTSWRFKFYQTSRYSYPIWKMCVTPNYDKVATYDGGSTEEQESMRDCLTEAFSIYYRYTLTSENNRPCIWDNARAMFKEKVLYSTPTSLYEQLYLRGRDGKQTLLDQIADILCDIDSDLYRFTTNFSARRYNRNRTRGCLLSPSGTVIKLDHITDEQSILDGIYRYDIVSSVLVLAPNAPSVEKSVFAYEKEGYAISTISRLLAIPTGEVRALLRA